MIEIGYFYRVPNKWIREKPPDLKRVCVYYLLNKFRGISDNGMITLKYIIENCGYKCRTGSDGVNGVYKNILQTAISQHDIIPDYDIPVNAYSPTEGISYTVNSDSFDVVDNFTKLTDTEFDSIIRNNSSRDKENILGVYLYIKSFYHPYTSVNRPIGFHNSLSSISKALDISERVLIKALSWLVEQKLLIKYYVGSIETDNVKKPRKNVPNIYIPNLEQSQDEIDETIKSTVSMMQDFYSVDEFLPFMKNLKEN